MAIQVLKSAFDISFNRVNQSLISKCLNVGFLVVDSTPAPIKKALSVSPISGLGVFELIVLTSFAEHRNKIALAPCQTLFWMIFLTEDSIPYVEAGS